MIKFNTVGMIQTSRNNPTLRLDCDVWNYNFITVDNNLYLVSNNATGDNNAEHDVLIPAGEPLNCYLIKAFNGQELIVDYKNLEDSSSTLSVGDVLVIGDNNKLKPGTASGIFFVVTKINSFLTEPAVVVKISTVAQQISGSGGNPNRVQVIEGTVNLPWPGIDMVDFWWKLKNGEASAKAVFNINGILEEGVLFARGRPEDGVYYILGSGAGDKNTPSALSGVLYLNIFWEILPRGTADDEQDIVLVENAFSVRENTVTNYIYTEDQEMIDFILSVPVTTTIIYHPLPEGQEG